MKPFSTTAHVVLCQQLARQPLSTENLVSTWSPPDWEDLIEYWDEFVKQARALTGEEYRNDSDS